MRGDPGSRVGGEDVLAAIWHSYSFLSPAMFFITFKKICTAIVSSVSFQPTEPMSVSLPCVQVFMFYFSIIWRPAFVGIIPVTPSLPDALATLPTDEHGPSDRRGHGGSKEGEGGGQH